MHIFIVAGDASGDVYGAQLIDELKKIDPTINVSGLGGDMMGEKMNMFYNLVKEFSVMGFIPVILGMPKVMRFLEITLNAFDQNKPDLLVLIDYPGFNLYLATHAKTRGIPSIYYVTPQIWAWAPWRIKKIKKFISKMLVIFPFEEKFYKDANVPVSYVGHPLLDKIAKFRPSGVIEELVNVLDKEHVLAILPGSRKREITLNLPMMLKLAAELNEKQTVSKILIALGSDKYLDLAKEKIKNFTNLTIEIVVKNTYNVIRQSRLAIVTSGTATLETAILQTPLVVVYGLPKFHHWVFSNIPFLQCDYIALPNIISDKFIVPEHIFSAQKSQAIYPSIENLWINGKIRSNCLMDLKILSKQVASPGASKNAATEIISFLN